MDSIDDIRTNVLKDELENLTGEQIRNLLRNSNSSKDFDRVQLENLELKRQLQPKRPNTISYQPTNVTVDKWTIYTGIGILALAQGFVYMVINTILK